MLLQQDRLPLLLLSSHWVLISSEEKKKHLIGKQYVNDATVITLKHTAITSVGNQTIRM